MSDQTGEQVANLDLRGNGGDMSAMAALADEMLGS